MPDALTMIRRGLLSPRRPLKLLSFAAVGGLGRAALTFGLPIDSARAKLAIYRVPTGGVLNRANHLVAKPDPATTYTDGDGAIVNGYNDGTFDSAPAHLLGQNWGVAAGVASHTAGAATAWIEQAKSLNPGDIVRTSFTVTAYTAGTVLVGLHNGTDRLGASRALTGTFTQSLTVNAGNTAWGFRASANFVGSIDNGTLFLQTPTCTPAGTFDYYVCGIDAFGREGPMSVVTGVAII